MGSNHRIRELQSRALATWLCVQKLRAAKGLLIAARIKTQSPKLREAGSSFLIPGINRRLRLSPTYTFNI